MTAIRVSTLELTGMLTDLLHTAATDPDEMSLCSLLMHTERGHWGDEPGRVDLLVGSSTNRYTAGHTYIRAAGQWPGHEPMLWSTDDVTVLLAALRKLCPDKKNTEHSVELCRDERGMTVQEDADLFGEGTSLTFPVRSAEQYPIAMLFRALSFDGSEPTIDASREGGSRVVPVLPRTDAQPAVLTPFVKVATRRGYAVRMYRYHQSRPTVVQIGDTYRGVIMPFKYDDQATDGHHPEAQLYPPPLPVDGPTVLRDGSGLLTINLDKPDGGDDR